jgi:3-dehydroquinate dehydratase-2
MVKNPKRSKKTIGGKAAGSKSINVLVANGVNLDVLGDREEQHYGSFTLADVEENLREFVQSSHAKNTVAIELHFFQSNDESALLDEIAKDWDGIVINAGAWTHTSLALADRLVAIKTPFVEVHISNTYKRESFRQRSYLAPHAAGVVIGFGKDSYRIGLAGLLLKVMTP